MSDDGAAPWPHKPAPAEVERVIPEWPMLSRGLGLMALAVGSVGAASWLVRRAPRVGAVLTPALGVAAILAAWAGAIHLRGGERFDDHKWV